MNEKTIEVLQAGCGRYSRTSVSTHGLRCSKGLQLSCWIYVFVPNVHVLLHMNWGFLTVPSGTTLAK